MINSLHIKGFRGFEDLKLEGLGRANLIIGQNNAGKTSLLEAIYLLKATDGDPFVAVCRDEDLPTRHLELFNGRIDGAGAIEIGEGVPELDFRMAMEQGMFHVDRHVLQGQSLHFRIGEAPPPMMAPTSPLFMGPGAATATSLAQIWEAILFTPYHDDVKACLRLVVPNLKDVALSPKNRKPIVRLDGEVAPVTMASLGGGAARLFQLACHLVVSGGKVLLIDEIEIGVHHSVQAEMWAFVFRVARTYDVQVFATTHSLDCLRGFAQASAELPELSARVIRLEKQRGKVVPVAFDQRQFQIAAFEDIEIR